MTTPEQVRSAAESYIRHLVDRDRDRWLDLFADDATLVDPVPSDGHAGREAIGAFFDGLAAMAERSSVELRALHVCGDEAALVYQLTLGPASGGGMAFEGVGILAVDDHGLITSARAYWDPAEIHRVDP